MGDKWVYTVWYFNSQGVGNKKYYVSALTKLEVKKLFEDQGNTQVLVWIGNWFGLTPDNRPEPDDTYKIPQTRTDDIYTGGVS